jgi:hypothetical protein
MNVQSRQDACSTYRRHPGGLAKTTYTLTAYQLTLTIPSGGLLYMKPR